MKRIACLAAAILALAACKKDPKPVSVTGITLDQPSITVNVGETGALTATVAPDDADNKDVSWSTDKPSVATVSDGIVTGVAAGKATITATSADGGFTATCEVTVATVPVTGISIEPSSLTLSIGDKGVLTATITPANATDKSITWASMDGSVITAPNGEYTAKGEGTTVIVVYALGGNGVVKAECNVTVKAKSSVPSGAVDLGITVKGSGGTTYKLYWADRNLGATSPEANGDYYAWGEVESKTNYSWSTYKWSNGAYNKLTKYCPTGLSSYWTGSGSPDGKLLLDPEDDAAHAKLGGNWRMPTLKEWMALDNCEKAWTTQNGVKGLRITGDNGNSIFLPAAGFKKDTDSAGGVGIDGYYWTSDLRDDSPEKAWDGFIREGTFSRSSPERCNGYTVRPVYQPAAE
ncbi:MAG: Ig-like domain-containing protein [Bacteroidales bacterium]|nr:Ig-like domain-containing protein [Bacteroidales bacterium]